MPPSLSFNSGLDKTEIVQAAPNTPATPGMNINTGHEPSNKVDAPTTPSVYKEKSSFIDAVKKWDFSKVIWVVYLLGTSVFILTFLIQFVILLLKKRNLEKIIDGKYTIYELEDNSSPFSFFHWIFINPSIYEPDTFDQILEHEKIHVSQSHYIDKLIAELAVILFWYNPFAWLYRKAITNNLEFLTDAEILETGTEAESYQMSLLRVSVPQHPLTLTTNYNQSFLEQRIKMMNERKSSAQSSWKYLLALPLILLSMASLNAVQISDQKSDAVVQLNDRSDADEKSMMASENEHENENVNHKAVSNDNKKGIVNTETENMNNTISTNITLNLDEIINAAVNTGLSQASESIGKVISENEHDTGIMHDVKPGHWKASINGKKVCVVVNHSSGSTSKWTTSTCFPRASLGNIPFDEEGEFVAVRDQGELYLNGVFDGETGEGTYMFKENESFKSFLKSKKYGSINKNEQFLMFMCDLDKSVVEELQAQGFDMDVQKLVEVAVHHTTAEEIRSYVEILERLSITHRSSRKLIEFAIHNITYDYADEILNLNLDGMNYNKLLAAKIHGVDAEYVNELSEAGYKNMSISRIIEFKIHGVSTAEMSEIKDMGYENIPADKLVEFQIHGVTPTFIKGFEKIGYSNISPERLIEFAIHGVSPDDVSEMHNAGYSDISPQKLIEFAIHGVDSDFLQGFADIGYNDIGSSKLVEFAIHGVTPAYVRKMKDIGYDDISSSKLIEMKIHGVDPNFVKDVQSMGLNDLSINKIIEFAIHGVSSDYVSGLQSVGLKNLSAQNLIEGRIHGVSEQYYQELKDLNIDGLSFRKLVEGRIHNVSPDFIQRARKKGYKPSTLSEYIDLKIHGF